MDESVLVQTLGFDVIIYQPHAHVLQWCDNFKGTVIKVIHPVDTIDTFLIVGHIIDQ